MNKDFEGFVVADKNVNCEINYKELIVYLNNLKKIFFQGDQNLSYEQKQQLWIFFKLERDFKCLNDKRLEYLRFLELYTIYHKDISFNGNYFKKNHDIKISELISLEQLKKINASDYNPEKINEINNLFQKHGFLTQVEKVDVEKDKHKLISIAKKWASICIDERHSDERLKLIAKETRDIIGSKNLNKFLNNPLEIDVEDAFKGILKSYYVFNESIKIIETIEKNSEPTTFYIKPFWFELHFSSIIHIIYRHYGQILSSSSLQDKTYHEPKVKPQNINFLLYNLTKAIDTSKIEFSAELGKAILFEFKDEIYAFYIEKYKEDKSKLIVKTFFMVDEENNKAIHLKKRIESSEKVRISADFNILISD